MLYLSGSDNVILVLRLLMRYESVGDDGSSERKRFNQDLTRDLSIASYHSDNKCDVAGSPVDARDTPDSRKHASTFAHMSNNGSNENRVIGSPVSPKLVMIASGGLNMSCFEIVKISPAPESVIVQISIVASQSRYCLAISATCNVMVIMNMSMIYPKTANYAFALMC